MNLKTPGVYVRDASPVLPAIEQIETGIPVFIGITEWAENERGESLNMIPTRIRDIGEFNTFFGGAYRPNAYELIIDQTEGRKVMGVEIPTRLYLYEALQQFFDNEGGDCYILSVALFDDVIFKVPDPQHPDQKIEVLNTVDLINSLNQGIAPLNFLDEPDLMLFPDAMVLGLEKEPKASDVGQLFQQALAHCDDRKDRFLIADVMMNSTFRDPAEEFRKVLGINNLKYGAAYYPYLFSNYSHAFHFHELTFFEDDGQGKLIAIDSGALSSKEKSEAAKAQRALVEEAKRWNGVVLNMLNLLNKVEENDTDIDETDDSDIEELSRDNVLKLPQTIGRLSNSLSVQGKKGIEVFLNGIQRMVLSFNALDGNIPPILQAELSQKITADNIPGLTESLIGWEKAAPIRNLYDPPIEVEEVERVYKALTGTQWINELAVEDIEPAQLPNWNEEEALNFLLDTYVPAAIVLSRSLKGLFEEAFEQEKIAEDRLFSQHPFFTEAATALSLELKKLPPSGTMAGIYAQTDRNRGVFKAPANVRIQASLGPVKPIDDRTQEYLNVHTTGKSINAIRAITGRGTRVWGARTLDGNSLEWRYVPVRRYFNYVEEVLKKSAESFVFEPNDVNTWTRVRLFLNTFLTREWRSGALNGNSPDEAFFIHIGLGESMTSQDILEGRMIIEIGLAVVRPAEFIVVRYICRMENV